MSPYRSIDTEIPCFTVDAATVDHTLLLVENLRDIQAADPSCSKISTLFGAHPLVEYDDFGVLGRLLPSGHIEPELPELLRKKTPVTVVRDLPLPLPESTPHVRVDASHLRRGVQSDEMKFRSTWRTLLTRCYPKHSNWRNSSPSRHRIQNAGNLPTYADIILSLITTMWAF
jgi:hypothetical protein